MSVVIVGGNERMVCQYETICKELGHTAKVFAKEKGGWKKQLGTPDLVVLFTSTVSHKMVNNALQEARRNRIPVTRVRSSSVSALKTVLAAYQMG